MHKLACLSFISGNESIINKLFWWVLPIHKSKRVLEGLDVELWIIEVPFYFKYFNRVKKFLIKENISDIIIKDLNKLKQRKTELILAFRDFNIYDGKNFMFDNVDKILNLISKYSNRDINKYRIGILGRNILDIDSTNIICSNKVRFLNVFLEDTQNLEKYIEEIYDEYGLAIEPMPIEKALIGNSDIVINLLNTEIKTKPYNIFINIGDSILSSSCKGIIINDVFLKCDIESDNRDITDTSSFIEFLNKKGIECEYVIQGFLGVNGKIVQKEFLKKN